MSSPGDPGARSPGTAPALPRWILHCDCNGFFASVECLDDPSLRLVPMAVAGDPKSRHGIILAKNEAAKKYGIQTTDTLRTALSKCPSLTLVPPRHRRYEEVSGQVNAVYLQYTDQVEPFGIDESFLDVTGSLALFGDSAPGLADRIREQVKREVGVTVSVGVSFNKTFAKIGSDMKKPDATTVILRENFRQLVWPLPVSALLFVGGRTDDLLGRKRIRTIGDLARADRDWLSAQLGKGGDLLWRHANGLDDDPVRPFSEGEAPKSIGNGLTFRRDLRGEEDIRAALQPLTDEVSFRLRQRGLRCGGVQVHIRDPELKTHSRQMTLEQPTNLHKEIFDAALAILLRGWRRDAPIRALTVTGIHLVKGEGLCEQVSLLSGGGPSREKLERLEKAVFSLRGRHGVSAIARGARDCGDLGVGPFRSDDAT